ncbi:unnamed protein product [Paramecium pentaurelia]|uniref:Uncharacterized protein n=1 Tax=Paramecium pentaurelia TaxID=43138 RepID=A0A8S1TZ62_9CILI|nr:unnamed protein product [Paramecium pentaurelia]
MIGQKAYQEFSMELKQEFSVSFMDLLLAVFQSYGTFGNFVLKKYYIVKKKKRQETEEI